MLNMHICFSSVNYQYIFIPNVHLGKIHKTMENIFFVPEKFIRDHGAKYYSDPKKYVVINNHTAGELHGATSFLIEPLVMVPSVSLFMAKVHEARTQCFITGTKDMAGNLLYLQ